MIKHLNLLLAATLTGCNSYRYSRQGLRGLPSKPGIYLVRRGLHILYIGKTKNLAVRWNFNNETGECDHHNYNELRRKSCQSLIAIPIPNILTHGGEAMLIGHINPTVNGRREPFKLLGWLWAWSFVLTPLVVFLSFVSLFNKFGSASWN